MKRAFRHYSHGRPPQDFIRSSPPLDPAAAQKAWAAFQQWLKRDTPACYAQFWLEQRKKREAANKALKDWPNPFVNARKGKPYRIEFSLPGPLGRYFFHKADLAAAGLTMSAADAAKCTISGTPMRSGSFNIRFACTWKGKIPGLPLLARTFQFFVNADPRELWHDIPSDQSGEYCRPDAAYADLATPHAIMWGASKRGRSHAHTGSPRDDAFELGFQNGWHMLAVADGAGSAPYSRKGAELACATALAASKDRLEQATELEEIFGQLPARNNPAEWLPVARKLAWNILPYAALESRKMINREAEARERETRAYATTLLLAMAKKYPAGWAVLSFQAGDGAMALIDKNGATLLAKPDEGEFGGQTRFVTMPEIFTAQELAQRLRIEFVEELSGLILMTDGISDPFFAGASEFENQATWTELWTRLCGFSASQNRETEVIDWLNFWSKGNHDDRTIAVLQTTQPAIW